MYHCLFESIVCLIAQLQKLDLGVGQNFLYYPLGVTQGTRGMVKGAVSIHIDVTERLPVGGSLLEYDSGSRYFVCLRHPSSWCLLSLSSVLHLKHQYAMLLTSLSPALLFVLPVTNA